MAITVYRSTDASAPVLTGLVGSLTALLQACLVVGYGSKAPAGWTMPYTATNGATFRPGSGVQHYFHVDDNAPYATAAGKEAQFRGSETATAFQTGTGFFPTTAQIALGAGIPIRKSISADATARPWLVVADGRTCYVFAQTGDLANVYCGATFGEFYSLLTTTDAYRSIVIGRSTVNSGSGGATFEMLQTTCVGAQSGLLASHYVPRAYTGIGGAQLTRKWGDPARTTQTANSMIGNGGLLLPEPISGAIQVTPIHHNEISNTVRGRMRGMFAPCHQASANNGFADGETIVGSGAYAGRTFLAVVSLSVSCVLFDVTGPWETN